MDYKEKYEQGLECLEEILNSGQEKIKMTLLKERLLPFFPELKESEDERIRKELIFYLGDMPEDTELRNGVTNRDVLVWLEKQDDKDKLIKELGKYKVRYTQEVLEKHINSISNKDNERLRKTTIAFLKDFADKGYENAVECIDWLKKQDEHKPIMNTPTREVILAIWDLGNEWKELTNGSISTKYGTQLDYIQKHWHESEYYLREKQSEKKLTFNADDWYVSKVDGKIHDMTYNPADKVEQKSKETIKPAQEIIDDWHKRQGTSVKTTAYGTFGKYGVVEYVYILDYCSGRVIVAKHDTEESIETLFDRLGLKKNQCHYMVSDKILSIEYINF